MKTTRWLRLLPLLLLTAAPVRGDFIAAYSFSNAPGTQASSPVDIQPTGATFSDYARSNLTGNAGTNTISASGWPSTTAPDTTKFFGFTITPAAGYGVTLTNFYFLNRRSSTGATNWCLRSSLDGFVSDITTGVAGASDRTTNIALGASFSGLTSAISFRLYGYLAQVGGSGTWRNDDVKLFGSIDLLGGPPANPSAFTATGGSYEMALGWARNAASNDVLVAFSPNDVFGAPAGGYAVRDEIAGGGTVLFSGNGTNVLQAGLANATTTYYRAWSYDASTNYSSGVGATGTTADATLPALSITTTNQGVSHTTLSITVDGTANGNVVGELAWTNNLTGGSGTAAAGLTWSLPGIGLLPGPNVITVTGTNAAGAGAGASVTITRADLVVSTNPWLNEIHYDEPTADSNEYVEVAGPAGLNLAGFSLVLYNGSGGAAYLTTNLTGVIDDEGGGFGAVVAWTNAGSFLQNGNPDGLALVHSSDTSVLQFISYGGSFTAADGPAAGMTSSNIGVTENGISLSLQLAGTGAVYSAFRWIGPTNKSPGWLNLNQQVVGTGPQNPSAFAATGLVGQVDLSWVLNAATDAVVVAWSSNAVFGTPAGAYAINDALLGGGTVIYIGTNAACSHTGLVNGATYYYRAWSVDVLTNYSYGVGASAVVVDPTLPALALDTTNQAVDFGTASIGISGTANANVVGELSWTNRLTGSSGTAPAATGWAIGGVALALGPNVVTVSGSNAAGVVASASVTLTRLGAFLADSNLWINEVHYNDVGVDSNEYIEVAGVSNLDLSAWSLVLYDGFDGLAYSNIALAGSIDDEMNGVGAVVAWTNGSSFLQNGSPDGIALVYGGTGVVQFLSYGGAMTASNGVATGLAATDIGLTEGPTGTVLSLQLTGSGAVYSAFAWTGPATRSPGALNAGQVIPYTGPATPFSAWATVHGLSAGSETNDNDGDGHNNLFEYSQNSNPTNGAGGADMVAGVAGGALQIRFVRYTNAADLTYIVEAADGVATGMAWSIINSNVHNDVWSDPPRASETGLGEMRSVTVTDPVTAATHRVLRLRVTKP